MKKRFVIILLSMMLLFCTQCLSDEETWICSECGNEAASGKFCSECGAKKVVVAEDEQWKCYKCGNESTGKFCSECGTPKDSNVNKETQTDNTRSTKIIINFEHNKLLATYDVDMYLDGNYIATLTHGRDFADTVQLAAGSHTIDFYENGDKDVNGSLRFDVDGDTQIECDIKAKTLYILVDNIRQSDSQQQHEIIRNQNTTLTLDVQCEENDFFSKYDVDVYIDRNYIATISHGSSLLQTISILDGKHTISFYASNDSRVNGSVTVDIEGSTKFQCEIHCKKNKIKIDHSKVLQ